MTPSPRSLQQIKNLKKLTAVALTMMLSQISFGKDMYFSISRSCTTESWGGGGITKRAHQVRERTHNLCLYHIAHSLIKGMDVVWLEVTDDGPDVVEDLFNERHDLHRLNLMIGR